MRHGASKVKAIRRFVVWSNSHNEYDFSPAGLAANEALWLVADLGNQGIAALDRLIQDHERSPPGLEPPGRDRCGARP